MENSKNGTFLLKQNATCTVRYSHCFLNGDKLVIRAWFSPEEVNTLFSITSPFSPVGFKTEGDNVLEFESVSKPKAISSPHLSSVDENKGLIVQEKPMDLLDTLRKKKTEMVYFEITAKVKTPKAESKSEGGAA